MSIFMKASRLKIRFNTNRGLLSVEDLWDLPLQSAKAGQPNLDEIAVLLSQEVKAKSNTESFVKPQLRDEELEVKFEVVKEIITLRLAENAVANQARELKAKKEKIMEIIQRKKDVALEGTSLEELEKTLASL